VNKIEVSKKANYCASCITKPCQLGCPLNNDITGFIKSIKNKKYENAYRILSNTTVLPSLCGRICPHERQCEGMCVKGVSSNPVSIGDLEAFIGDLSIKNNWKIDSPKKTKYRVAVIGGGPAGLTCAAFLRRNGIGVTIYEKHDYLGGILMHGIPEFRLPKDLVKSVTDRIIELGIDVKYNQELGKDIKLKELEKEYDAVFLGIGTNISGKMNIPGENLQGVYGANELLENNIKLNYKGKTVVVSGGGNVAMDVSRSIKRMGAKRVIVVYRRSEDDMPAEKKEIKDAKKEGIEFLFLNSIIEIHGDSKVESIELVKTKLIKQDGESRLLPINIDGSNYQMPCDYVMMAVGSHPDDIVLNELGLQLDRKGKIDIDPLGHTSNKKIFSGGDIAGVTSTVAWASRSGRNAAYEIIKFLKETI
jgi:glutamate synthase (NADPH/NADH) small chain